MVDAERDTIVLALRVLRVLQDAPKGLFRWQARCSADHSIGIEQPSNENRSPDVVSLDEAERMLGIGGE